MVALYIILKTYVQYRGSDTMVCGVVSRSREEEAKRHAAQSTPTAEAEGKDSGEEKGHDEKGRGAKGMDEDEEQRGQGGWCD
jgi:hypothetical protein